MVIWFLRETQIILYFLIWLVGVGVYEIRYKIMSFYPALVLFALSAILSRIYHAGGYFPTDLMVALTFGLLLNSVLRQEKVNRVLAVSQPVNQAFAGFSFTLYVLHVPLITMVLFLFPELFSNGKPQPHQLEAWAVYVFTAIVTLLSCFVIAQVTESNTYAVRCLILNRLNATTRRREYRK